MLAEGGYNSAILPDKVVRIRQPVFPVRDPIRLPVGSLLRHQRQEQDDSAVNPKGPQTVRIIPYPAKPISQRETPTNLTRSIYPTASPGYSSMTGMNSPRSSAQTGTITLGRGQLGRKSTGSVTYRKRDGSRQGAPPWYTYESENTLRQAEQYFLAEELERHRMESHRTRAPQRHVDDVTVTWSINSLQPTVHLLFIYDGPNPTV